MLREFDLIRAAKSALLFFLLLFPPNIILSLEYRLFNFVRIFPSAVEYGISSLIFWCLIALVFYVVASYYFSVAKASFGVGCILGLVTFLMFGIVQIWWRLIDAMLGYFFYGYFYVTGNLGEYLDPRVLVLCILGFGLFAFAIERYDIPLIPFAR